MTIDTQPFMDGVIAGLNNPECSFWVGATMGHYAIAKLVIAMVGFALLWRLIDRLAWEPLIEWVRSKWWKK